MVNKNIHVLSRAVILDQGHLLVCQTLDLPVNFYFLPGGHVEHGESAEQTILRELVEECGCVCTIIRFLGCLEYSFEPVHSSICHNHEYNFIFEARSEELTIHKKIPQLEPHIKFVWLPLDQIDSIDFRAEPLKILIPQWLERNTQTFSSVMA